MYTLIRSTGLQICRFQMWPNLDENHEMILDPSGHIQFQLMQVSVFDTVMYLAYNNNNMCTQFAIH